MFNQFNNTILKGLNIMEAKLDGLLRMRSDKYINIKRAGNGTTLSLNIREVTRSMATAGGDDSGAVHRATCTQGAPNDDTITATLINSAGTTGDPITVTCLISNGTALDEATPRLESGDIIVVSKLPFDNAGTPSSKWYCVTNFMATEECTCEQPDAVFNSVTIAADEKLTFDGVGGDSYYIYNSSAGEMEHYVDGVKVTSW